MTARKVALPHPWDCWQHGHRRLGHAVGGHAGGGRRWMARRCAPHDASVRAHAAVAASQAVLRAPGQHGDAATPGSGSATTEACGGAASAQR